MDPGQRDETTMSSTTALLAAITTVTVSLEVVDFDACNPARYAAELTTVFPAAEVEVKRGGIESVIDARGEVDGEDLRIIQKRGRVDILTGADEPSDADETIRALLARAWERQFA